MDPVKTAQELIAYPSVTATANADVSEYMQTRLEQLRFQVDALPYVDQQGIGKICLAAKREPLRSASSPGIAYFCHNDVVSVEGWNCGHGGPFAGVIEEQRLWGRGACDMKGSAAAALSAMSRIDPQTQTGPLYFFVTGDEECGMAGARLLSEQSPYLNEMVADGAVGIIGEPTELQVVNAHKGGCHVDVTSRGVAAHSSTAEGRNANWQLIPFLSYLRQLSERFEGDPSLRNPAFSPSGLSLNVVLENEPSSANITVGRATCRIFFRPMPDTPWENVLDEILATAHDLALECHALPALPPLHTPADRPFVQTALKLLQQTEPQAVSYATDGCCFPQLADLIVLGPGSIAQAHRPDEWIALEQLQRGVEVYSQLFRHYACG